jgi:hypothetical protein
VCGSHIIRKNHVTNCFFILFSQKDIAITIPPSSVLMVSLQADFQKSVERNRQRQACQDARSTVGWSIKQEEDWQSTLEVTRNGYVVWISALGNE